MEDVLESPAFHGPLLSAADELIASYGGGASMGEDVEVWRGGSGGGGRRDEPDCPLLVFESMVSAEFVDLAAYNGD